MPVSSTAIRTSRALAPQYTLPSSRRHESTSAAAAAATNPKISAIVDQIGGLTLLETADLVGALKVRPARRSLPSPSSVH